MTPLFVYLGEGIRAGKAGARYEKIRADSAKKKAKEPTHEVLALSFRSYAELFYCF